MGLINAFFFFKRAERVGLFAESVRFFFFFLGKENKHWLGKKYKKFWLSRKFRQCRFLQGSVCSKKYKKILVKLVFSGLGFFRN